MKWPEKHYAPRERGDSAEVEGITTVCGVLSELFGRLPVASFGPKALKQARERPIGLNRARKYVNKQIHRLKRMFRWAGAEETAPDSDAGRLGDPQGGPEPRTSHRLAYDP